MSSRRYIQECSQQLYSQQPKHKNVYEQEKWLSKLKLYNENSSYNELYNDKKRINIAKFNNMNQSQSQC